MISNSAEAFTKFNNLLRNSFNSKLLQNNISHIRKAHSSHHTRWCTSKRFSSQAKMHTLSTTIQQSTRNTSQSNNTRKIFLKVIEIKN